MTTPTKTAHYNWRPFQEARAFVHNLGLKGKDDWAKWCKTAARPTDIPANPPNVYGDKGWLSWGDWLGTGSVWVGNRRFQSFEKARLFAQSLELKNQSEWREWAKTSIRPADIPAWPPDIYKDNGWTGWGDWLGTGTIANQNRTYRPFEEARLFARGLGLKNGNEWVNWAKTSSKPNDIPAYPAGVYKHDGWAGWGDWLGTGAIASFNKTYRSFQKARTFSRGLGLHRREEWSAWTKTNARPEGIPANPAEVYKDRGWMGWGDWLGTGRIANQGRVYRSFQDARMFARNLNLQNEKAWRTWAMNDARPGDIPANPYTAYRDDGWISWGDWLGTRNRKGGYRPFQEARGFARSLGFANINDWNTWSKSVARPADIPVNPAGVYKDNGWDGWGDWLGTGRIATKDRVYRPFLEDREFVGKFGLKNKHDWIAWTKTDARPVDIPSDPRGVYKNSGWKSWGDWLGTGRIATQNMSWRSFEEARLFARNLGLLNQSEWDKWVQSDARPADIPVDPAGAYKNVGWMGWGDWLGTGRIAAFKRSFRPFLEARAFARELGLQNQADWQAWAKSKARPNDIPAGPSTTYRDNGWAGWGDWLGTGRTANRDRVYRPFQEARLFARELGFRNSADWNTWSKSGMRPEDIPANPAGVYKDKGWTGWGDWLGSGYIANRQRIYRLFEEARDFARSLKYENEADWNVWSKSNARPDDIPANPAEVYRDSGWKSMGDWLGTGRVANQDRTYRSFQAAHAFVSSLGLQNSADWRKWAKSDARPDDIPADPAEVYRDSGWESMGNWLVLQRRFALLRRFEITTTL